MKTFTLITFFLYLIAAYIQPGALAQGDPTELITTTGACEASANCLAARIDEITVLPEDPTQLRIVVIVTTTENAACGTFQTMNVEATGGPPVSLGVEEIVNGDHTIVLFVNNDTFLSSPQVTVDAHSQVNLIGTANVFYQLILTTGLEPGGTPCIDIVPLPVELVYFKGKVAGSDIVLEWGTAFETDNKHFQVERSSDGRRFAPVGTVPGNGNTSTPISYTYKDIAPPAGTNYYRLKQIDFDEDHEYSAVMAVEAVGTTTESITLDLAPNPCYNGNCNLNIRPPAGTRTTLVQLRDMTGKVVYSQELNTTNSPVTDLPMPALGNYRGVFILTATTNAGVLHKRVVLE